MHLPGDVPLKVLVPVLPSERFYDAVVAAGDAVAAEGGTITFLFTSLRPPPDWEEKEDIGFQAALDPDPPRLVDAPDEVVESWHEQMREGLEDAYALLRERGVGDHRMTVLFADDDVAPAQAIADEAAAGAYDMVVLAKSEMINMPDIAGGDGPIEIARAVQELADEGVKLVVT